jgi:glycosyltransferase involved in cell wall biosynthesis
MKILFLQHALGYGGATKSLLLMQQAIEKHCDCEIQTVVPTIKRKHKDIVSNFKHSEILVELLIPVVYSHSESTMKLNDFDVARSYCPNALIDYINRNEIDILHVNSTLYSNILEPVRKNTRCKIVVHLREMLPNGPNNPVDSFIIDKYTQFADAIISISDNELRFFSRKDNVYVVPNPHDFSVTDDILRLGNSAEKPIVIGMCSNFLPIKGHLIFLEAAKIVEKALENKNIDLEFRIIGYPKASKNLKTIIKDLLNTSYKSKFDSKARRVNLKNLKITPFSFDIYHDLTKVDVFIRPDITANPWGRDIIEAMALKKPVVATGTSEFYVENGITGYLVPPQNPEKLAEKIIELVNDPQKRLAMGEAGYAKIKSMCDLEEYGKKMMSIYQNLIN